MGVLTRTRDVVYGVYEWRLRKHLAGLPAPRHVGVILDGNRRWALEAGFADISDGYRAGGRKIAELLDWCAEARVELVTLFMLSSDNANRPREQLQPLLDVIADVVDQLAEPTNPWRIRIVGALDLLPADTAARFSAAETRTRDRDGVAVNIAVGYGGRQEIADAVRKLLHDRADQGGSLEELADELSADHITRHLYTSGQPDPDLVIRTSGEQRLSGFLLWQSVYSEFWFSEVHWPEFRRVDFLRALRDYANRHRRFGS
ncbi:isoprenyl transferase [Actinoalloteichus sp. AHMU CJ021]|uniref:Isoprenyl transferase n=1 Tax=Actinoalloteichus caeruleus DSM 43889 TaxID=1120930 RepID=A0ABT1JJK0_ACTCY|nr:isoprenyl transferase [Actinoalloteichus caeruleus]AUS78288.1 isoprenyl transferase [Actinoalloteichus sp. AHMU CJ021]MCP2332353.1 short-chain Z-isoprenyl diphosphate synthase [Actinoalloteichus caeruleus DSM 43889]